MPTNRNKVNCVPEKLTWFDRDGVRVWLEDGVLVREIPLGDGTCRHYHKNGALAGECQKVGGETHGLARGWHDNGVLSSEATYVNGKVQGTVRTWDRRGQLDHELEYVTENAIYGKSYADGGRVWHIFLWNGKPISKTRWLNKVERQGIARPELERRFGKPKPRAAK